MVVVALAVLETVWVVTAVTVSLVHSLQLAVVVAVNRIRMVVLVVLEAATALTVKDITNLLVLVSLDRVILAVGVHLRRTAHQVVAVVQTKQERLVTTVLTVDLLKVVMVDPLLSVDHLLPMEVAVVVQTILVVLITLRVAQVVVDLVLLTLTAMAQTVLLV